MSVLFGLVRPTAGSVSIRGNTTVIRNARDARSNGLAYVQQHFSLIPTLTVAENLALALSTRIRGYSIKKISRQIQEIGKRFGLEVDPTAMVADLTVGDQQRVELLKAIAADATILLLDEPGSSLTPQQTAEITGIVKRMTEGGVAVFYVSHSLTDVLRVADRISVLRRGHLVQTFTRADATAEALAEAMVGRPVVQGSRSGPRSIGERRVEVRALTTGDRFAGHVRGLSFEVRAGEIVGIAGVEGSGQVALTEALGGVRPFEGDVVLDGRSLRGAAVSDWRRRGVAEIPGDRQGVGIVRTLTVAEQLVVPELRSRTYSRLGTVKWSAVRAHGRDLMTRFDIRASGPNAAMSTLSGGNQQKTIVARELARDPALVVCCYPTIGLDFAAAAAVLDELRRASERGAAVIVASLDLEELVSVCDRIIVLHRGEIAGETQAHLATPERLGLMMGGVHAS
jgi:simple sugar transport system ATP-binding protein